MAVMDSKERVTIVLDKTFLAELDEFAKDTRVSRSAFLAGLIETGFRQTKATKRVFGNRFVAKALYLIFGDGIAKEAEIQGESAAMPNAAAEAIRQNIIQEIKKLSIAEAEAEINRDLGIAGDNTIAERTS